MVNDIDEEKALREIKEKMTNAEKTIVDANDRFKIRRMLDKQDDRKKRECMEGCRRIKESS